MATRTRDGYLSELLDIRDKLSEFLSHIRKGQLTYYKEVSIKLRILYCKKSGTEPLLKTIEQQYGFDILVVVTHSTAEKINRGVLPSSLGEGLVFEQINSVVTWFERGDEVVGIFDALNREEIFYRNQRFTYKHVIEVAADKMGGAHVDPKVPHQDLQLHSEELLIGGLPVAQRALYDTANTTIYLINAIEGFILKGEKYMFLKPRISKAL
jgi:hypothetical protein